MFIIILWNIYPSIFIGPPDPFKWERTTDIVWKHQKIQYMHFRGSLFFPPSNYILNHSLKHFNARLEIPYFSIRELKFAHWSIFKAPKRSGSSRFFLWPNHINGFSHLDKNKPIIYTPNKPIKIKSEEMRFWICKTIYLVKKAWKNIPEKRNRNDVGIFSGIRSLLERLFCIHSSL